jgi:hypothetical protein
MSAPTPAGGRFVAWVGFAFGSIMSIAANVLHTWIPKPPEGAPESWVPPADWSPSVAAQIGSAVWPVALLIAVEVLSRVAWPDTWQWNFARYGGAGTVAIGSAIISYGHLHEVLIAWHYTWIGAIVGPLVLDGLMVVSGFALLAMGKSPAAAEKPTVNKQWAVGAIEKRPNGQVVEPAVEAPAAEPKSDDEPDPEPPNGTKQNVRAIGDPKPWSARAQELMKDEGVSRATAYRRAKKEHERDCA